MKFHQHTDDTRNPSPNSSQHPWQLNLQHAFTSLQNQCAGLLHNFSNLQSSLAGLHSGARVSTATRTSPSSSKRTPFWAKIGDESRRQLASGKRALMSTEDIEERLAGVPVYALSNAEEEFVLVSGVSTGKSLGLFCFKKEDADALLDQMKSMDPGMRSGSQVVPVALNKVFQLKLNGVAFRLIPEPSQIKNALEVRQADGLSDEAFPGVPVFQNLAFMQSKSLILKSQNKSYSPVFFRKEDLENSLQRASRQQNRLNPAFRQGDIEVGVLEDIIKGMKESSGLKWNDVVFIPPGFDVSADSSSQSADNNA